MKNRYLSELAQQKRFWHLPAGLLSALMSFTTIQVWVEDSPAGEDPTIWLMAHAFVLVVMLLPIAFIVRWRKRQHDAWMLAEKLARRKEASIPLAELSRTLGVRNADQKVLDLLKRGFLKRLEVEDDELVLDNPQPESTPEPREAPPAEEDVIRQIRHLNDEIDDAAVSERIDRMEQVTASILRTLKERPERAEDARRFMNYYLPATLKLLESYRLMEKQSFQGENIQASRRQIEAVLEKLVSAAEQQQDKLFGSEALDVEAEISVLETMMASDGLIEPRQGMK